jgi:hypothetical protein
MEIGSFIIRWIPRRPGMAETAFGARRRIYLLFTIGQFVEFTPSSLFLQQAFSLKRVNLRRNIRAKQGMDTEAYL